MILLETKPFIAVYGKQFKINISLKVIDLLGTPAYITIYTNESMDSIALGVCEADNVMSFKVPNKSKSSNQLFITSKPFVTDIMQKNKLDTSKSYRIDGNYIEDKNIVEFNLSEAYGIIRGTKNND